MHKIQIKTLGKWFSCLSSPKFTVRLNRISLPLCLNSTQRESTTHTTTVAQKETDWVGWLMQRPRKKYQLIFFFPSTPPSTAAINKRNREKAFCDREHCGGGFLGRRIWTSTKSSDDKKCGWRKGKFNLIWNLYRTEKPMKKLMKKFNWFAMNILS